MTDAADYLLSRYADAPRSTIRLNPGRDEASEAVRRAEETARKAELAMVALVQGSGGRLNVPGHGAFVCREDAAVDAPTLAFEPATADSEGRATTDGAFIAPIAGKYHLGDGIPPHLISECSPDCGPFPGVAKGTMTVVEMDGAPYAIFDYDLAEAVATAPEIMQMTAGEVAEMLAANPPSGTLPDHLESGDFIRLEPRATPVRDGKRDGRS